MAGLTKDTPIPTEIKLHQASRVMELTFDNGSAFRLPYEFLRVYSPSAEVRGHGPGQETLQTGKPITPFMKFGDIVRIEMRARDGNDIFGAIEQRIERQPA